MNTKKIKILVFPSGTEIALEIRRAFIGVKDFELIGGTSIKDHGEYAYENNIHNFPFIDQELKFVDYLNKVLRKHQIKYIYPAHDQAILVMAKYLNKIKAKVLIPNVKTCKITRSKSLTYKELFKTVKTPKIHKSNHLSEDEFPVFGKPDQGQGSKETLIINNQHELDCALRRNPQLLILEYLPGEEYTIDCFTDFHGKLLYIFPRVRARTKSGISTNTYPYIGNDIKRINLIAHRISNKLNINGAWFFQLKRDINHRLVLLEVAPRIGGSSGLSRAMGVNLPLLHVYNYQKIPTKILFNQYHVEMDRALNNHYYLKNLDYKYIYVDFDDCLYVDNHLNLDLLYFLLLAIRLGKKLFLISKHQGNLQKLVIDLGIKPLFEKIILLQRGMRKSKHIKHSKSIFIDDSFGERLEVSSSLHIPVFSMDMLDVLISDLDYKNRGK